MASAQARWKRSADAAISSANFERQRRDLARCLAGRFLNPRGQATNEVMKAIAAQNRSLYETAIMGLLDNFSLRLSLAAKQLHLLYDNVRYSEQEDANALEAETKWTRAYYESIFQCPIPMNPEWDLVREPGERRSRSYDEFLAAVEATIAPHLSSALHSAAAA